MVTPNKVDEFLTTNGYSSSTIKRYGRALELAHKDLDLGKLTAVEFTEWLDCHGWGSSMKWVVYSAVRGFIRWQYGNEHPALKLKIKRTPASPQRTLSIEDASKILAIFDTQTIKGIRDLSICAVMLDAGLRSVEIRNLEAERIDLTGRRLAVICKGGNWGYGVFSLYTAMYLTNWFRVREDVAVSKYAFVGLRSGKGKQLTRGGFGAIVRSWGVAAGIKLSPHDFRRSFATISTQIGAPSRVVQEAGRWSDINMVERYTQAINASDFEEYFPVRGIMEKQGN